MKTVWRVTMDRFGLESVAKSGTSYSVIETAELLMESYERQAVKPDVVEIVSIGVGNALYDYLKTKNFPGLMLVKVQGLTSRVGSADVHKFRVDKEDNNTTTEFTPSGLQVGLFKSTSRSIEKINRKDKDAEANSS